MSEQNKATVRRLYEGVLGNGDLGLADELVAPEFIGHSTKPEDEARGIEAYKQFAAMLRSAFPDLQFTIEDQISEGDKVVTRWTCRGTHRGEYFGIAPTGKQGAVTGINLDRVAGGKLVECWSNSDDLGLMQQIGAVPAPSPA